MNGFSEPTGSPGVMGRMVLLDPGTEGTGSAVPAAPAVAPPAAAPAAPTPAAAPAPATPATEPAAMTMNTPVEYETAGGQTVNTTVGDLIKRHDQFQGMDPEQVKMIQGALNNEPDASKALLQQQMEKLTAGAAPPATAADEALAAVVKRQDQAQVILDRAEAVSQSFENQEIAATLRNILSTNEEVKKAVPFLAARPEVGIPMLTPVIQRLREASRAAGQGGHVSGDMLNQALSRMNAYVQSIVVPFGGTIPAPVPAGQVAPVVTVNQAPNQQLQPGGVIPPRFTVEQLLANTTNPALAYPAAQPANLPQNPNSAFNPHLSGRAVPGFPQQPMTVPVPAAIPQPGGQVAGAVVGQPVAAAPVAGGPTPMFTPNDMRNAIRQQQAQAEGGVSQ